MCKYMLGHSKCLFKNLILQCYKYTFNFTYIYIYKNNINIYIYYYI